MVATLGLVFTGCIAAVRPAGHGCIELASPLSGCAQTFTSIPMDIVRTPTQPTGASRLQVVAHRVWSAVQTLASYRPTLQLRGGWQPVVDCTRCGASDAGKVVGRHHGDGFVHSHGR